MDTTALGFPFAEPGDAIADWPAVSQALAEAVNDHDHELAYIEQPTNVSVSAISVGAANQIITAGALTFDGDPVIVRFECSAVTSINADVQVILRDGSTVLGLLSYLPSGLSQHISREVRVPLTAGVHTLNVASWLGSADTVIFNAGSGGAAGTLAASYPISLRVTRA